MANRPVFITKDTNPYYEEIIIDFNYNKGLSISQKQKNILNLHENFYRKYSDYKVLEISTKSMIQIGINLSAFNLDIITHKRKFSVECAFQASKVFQNGGPYLDILNKSSFEAKEDTRLKNSGDLIGFKYGNRKFPLEPKTFFYDWLYINTLYLNEFLKNNILQYNAFTDIEFNPKKSINCQARAAAIFVSLTNKNLIKEVIESSKIFCEIVYNAK